MNKRILLLYFKEEQKSGFPVCEEIFKALFRKFRVSATFTIVHLDTSPSCRDLMTKKIINEIGINDAVFLCHDDNLSPQETSFLDEIMGIYGFHHQNTGINIFFPYEKTFFREENQEITETVFYSIEKAEKLIKLCTDYAYKNAKTVFICTGECGIDARLFKDFERAGRTYRYLDINHMTPGKIIRESASCILKPCVILTRSHIADTLLLHTFTAKKMHSGYTVIHSDRGKIYKPVSARFSFEEIQKLRLLLIAFSVLIEDSFQMKRASLWLRKSIDTAFSEFSITNKEEFAGRIINCINEPIRKRSNDYEQYKSTN